MVFTFSFYNELTNHSASQMNDIWGRDRVYYKSFNQWIYMSSVALSATSGKVEMHALHILVDVSLLFP